MSEITNTPETNVYVQPIIDYDETGDNQDPKINLDPQYISSSESNNFVNALGFLASALVSKLPIDPQGVGALTAQLSFGTAPNIFELRVASETGNTTKGTIALCNMLTGVTLISLPVVLDSINGLKVLATLSKSNFLTAAASIILDDIITYEVIAKAYRDEYAIEYERAKISGDIIVNAGSASLEDIKKFLYYSDVLKQTQDVYVQQGTDVYKVVRGSEYDAIVNELARRGYYGGDDATDPTNDIDELSELYANSGTYRQNIDELTNDGLQIQHLYKDEKFILLKSNEITFPFQGNIYDNIIYLDNEGRASYGSVGNDTITGGTGNDTIYGDGGNDTYVFNLGDGKDTIRDSYYIESWEADAGNDTIKFGPGITKDNIIFSGDDVDLVVSFRDSNDSITILSQLSNEKRRIENFIFDDGTSYTYTDILNFGFLTTYGTSGDDSIPGSILNDKIYGGDGNDYERVSREEKVLVACSH